ncbi:hypothetical protein GCM10010495_81610 [Kitasatospora herbaricolor]|nr:hypothetical protein GCM10010252_78030 [Streptomyces aureoverticillatus]GGV51791.1 hypothetical protein GCM10010495_81610 [Kitasatospora herbaricolor]
MLSGLLCWRRRCYVGEGLSGCKMDVVLGFFGRLFILVLFWFKGV